MPVHKVKHKIDYLGAALLAVAASSLVLLTTWGGTQYPWRSAQIMGLGAVAIAATAAFIAVERRAAEPVLPLHVFRNRNFSLVTAMSFLLGLAMFGALTFLPLYQQTVQHLSATESGLMLIPLMLGSTVTTLIAGRITTRTGRYKALPIIGGAVMTVAMYLLTTLGVNTSLVTSGLYFVVLGVGMGFLMQITTLVAQNSVAMSDIGVASSSRTFFQQIGGSIGVSAFGAIFAHQLTSEMHAKLPSRSPQRRRRAAQPGRGRPPARGGQGRRLRRDHARDHDRVLLAPRRPRRRCSSWPASSRRCRCAAGDSQRRAARRPGASELVRLTRRQQPRPGH